uniref:Uncharacterized protein n=1 Tax=Medicago truncatula TaxID=3880 RepID=A2Q1N5_MEDTR|nr:hypothetical protein MtrDRAFT_AC148970g19v2 [Medicago truncatula]
MANTSFSFALQNVTDEVVENRRETLVEPEFEVVAHYTPSPPKHIEHVENTEQNNHIQANVHSSNSSQEENVPKT